MFHSQRRVDQVIMFFCFALFPKDQAFYLLVVICSSIYITSLTLMVYEVLPLYMIKYPEVKSPTCDGPVFMFAYPNDMIMLQAAFDATIFLLIFYTDKNSHLS